MLGYPEIDNGGRGRADPEQLLPMTVAPSMRIVYIAGSGRSGSTLLARILGQIDGFVSPGEMRHFWRTGAPLLAHDQLCGCGRPYDECQLWQPVVTEVFGRLNGEDLDGLQCLAESVDRTRYIPWMVSRRGPAGYRSRLGDYRRITTDLYSAVLGSSGASFLIDASKDPSTLFLLATTPGVRLTVVHLVRDIRGVTYSWRKRKVRPEFIDRRVYMQRHSVLKTVRFWLYGNVLSELSTRVGATYVRVRYEDFVREPRESVRSICRACGVEDPGLTFISDGACRLERENHMLSGNPNRFSGPEVRFRLDHEWRRMMPRGERLTASVLGLPLLLRYGYFGGGTAK